MSWRRMSVDSDGSPNGGPAFPQSPVPGAEASLTATLRNSYEHPRIVSPLRLLPLLHDYFMVYFHDPKRDEPVNPVFIPFSHGEYTTHPNTRHAPLIRYPFVSATRPSRIAGPFLHFIASNPFISFLIQPCLSALHFD